MTAEQYALRRRIESWRVVSPGEEGFHEVLSPAKSDCRAISIYRLNLPAGGEYRLSSGKLEMNAAVIRGSADIRSDKLRERLGKLDSFYLSAGEALTISALEPLTLYIGAAEGVESGVQSARHFDASLPLGDIHQLHGDGRGRREVMFTCEPAMPAQRLICGYTWSQEGSWTSWPPHQHEKDLEEAYCYFDMDDPHMGLHLSYLRSGQRQELVAHAVQSGVMVLAPRGYHPTVAMPGSVNSYFWVMAAFTPGSRRYDLAIPDPQLAE